MKFWPKMAGIREKTDDLTRPLISKVQKNLTSQFVPHATTWGQKSAKNSLQKCWFIEPKIKITELFKSQV